MSDTPRAAFIERMLDPYRKVGDAELKIWADNYEALEARLSKMEKAAINSPCRISIEPDEVAVHCDGCGRLHEMGREALAGESETT